jgi:hypothetical protein
MRFASKKPDDYQPNMAYYLDTGTMLNLLFEEAHDGDSYQKYKKKHAMSLDDAPSLEQLLIAKMVFQDPLPYWRQVVTDLNKLQEWLKKKEEQTGDAVACPDYVHSAEWDKHPGLQFLFQECYECSYSDYCTQNPASQADGAHGPIHLLIHKFTTGGQGLPDKIETILTNLKNLCESFDEKTEVLGSGDPRPLPDDCHEHIQEYGKRKLQNALELKLNAFQGFCTEIAEEIKRRGKAEDIKRRGKKEESQTFVLGIGFNGSVFDCPSRFYHNKNEIYLGFCVSHRNDAGNVFLSFLKDFSSNGSRVSAKVFKNNTKDDVKRIVTRYRALIKFCLENLCINNLKISNKKND